MIRFLFLLPGRLPASLFPCIVAAALTVIGLPGGAAEDSPPITEQQALDLAQEKNPDLAGYPYEIRAAEGRVLSASLRPNPEADLEYANFGGDLRGAQRSETTVGLSQRMELGGKRRGRSRRAAAEIPVLRRDYDSLRLTVAAEVRKAFFTVLGAQQRLELAREGRDIAARLASTAADQVAAGAVSPIEETRAKVSLAVAEADLLRAEKDVEEARAGLAAAIGLPRPDFGPAAGRLSEDISVPSIEDLSAGIEASPDLSRWDAETTRRERALAAERTLAVPDVTLSGSYRRLQENKEDTFVAALSLPLPVFDRNQGAIREAQAQLGKAEAERRAAATRIRNRLAQRHASLSAAAREAKSLRDGALVNAQSAYAAVSEGYNFGKFRYLDVLEAGRALIEAKRRHLEAVVDLNLARIDVERIVAAPIETAPPAAQGK